MTYLQDLSAIPPFKGPPIPDTGRGGTPIGLLYCKVLKLESAHRISTPKSTAKLYNALKNECCDVKMMATMYFTL